MFLKFIIVVYFKFCFGFDERKKVIFYFFILNMMGSFKVLLRIFCLGEWNKYYELNIMIFSYYRKL